MRTCIRCGTEMVEHCDLRVEGAGYGVVVAATDRKLFSRRLGKPKVAICPQCGEISLYVEDGEQLLRKG